MSTGDIQMSTSEPVLDKDGLKAEENVEAGAIDTAEKNIAIEDAPEMLEERIRLQENETTTALTSEVKEKKTPPVAAVLGDSKQEEVSLTSCSAVNATSVKQEEKSSVNDAAADALITDAMAREEEKMLEEGEKEEAELQKQLVEEGASTKSQSAKRAKLDTLLQKAAVYSSFIQSQMPEIKQGELEPTDLNQTEASTKGGTKKRGRSSGGKDTKKCKGMLKNATKAMDAQNSTIKSIKQPSNLTGSLRSYQVDGLRWMVSLWENGLNGILADEMGLGKTVQVISLFAHLREKKAWGPYLVVGPLSTLPNWLRECRKWLPEVNTILYHGTQDERAELRKKELKTESGVQARVAWQKSTSFPIVLTSFEIAMRDRQKLQHIEWKYIVVDEGHRLKNMNCRLIRELKLYSSQNRLLLTGTPLQNNLDELWSLLNFLLPVIFDDLHVFQSWFAFESVGETEGDIDIIANQRKEKVVTKLHDILRPFLLRRLKTQVLVDMPPKRELVVYTPMTECQRGMHQLIQTGELNKVLKQVGSKQTLRNMLMQMRKCCNHPFLFEGAEQSDENGQFQDDEELVVSSGKLQIMDKILPKLRKGGHKVLIFSQMTRMLDIIEDYLSLRGCGRLTEPDDLKQRHSKGKALSDTFYCRLDGSTKIEQRQQQMELFNENSNVFAFLLSTRAGGLGINLVSADTVIIYDSDWNPHQDSQAQDRCHRIGQTKPVLVFRLITENSVENRMLHRANCKRKLDRIVLQRGNFKTPGQAQEDLTVDELQGLLQNDVEIRESESGGISDKELAMIMERDTLEDGAKGDYPPVGKGYEVVSQAVASLLSELDN